MAPKRAHAAVGLVGAALVEEHLARRLLAAGEHRAQHHAVGTGGDRLGEVARGADAAVGDHRHALGPAARRHAHDRGQLRHADAGDDPRGADRARADADLDRVGAGLDQGRRRLAGGDVAGDDLGARWTAGARRPRCRARPREWPCAVSTTITSAPAAISASARSMPGVARAGGGTDAQPALRVLAGVREALRLLDVLDRDQADQAVGVVDHEQLLDPVLVQQLHGLGAADALAHRDQPLGGHQLAHRPLAARHEADVAVGEDADQPAARPLDHRQAGDAVALHQVERLAQRRLGPDA